MQNYIEFYSDKPIQDNELDIILLYLENSRRSNGGEYEEHSLDSKRHLLSVKFTDYSTKLRLLQGGPIKITFNLKEFNLIPNEPIDFEAFELNKKVIILKNIDSSVVAEDLITLYAENLVINDDNDNEVVGFYQSTIYPKTIYVNYKKDYDPNMIQSRYEQRKSLSRIPIEFKPAYETKIALVKTVDRNGQEIPREIIEMHFSNRRRCGGESYLSIHEREPFLLLSYDSQEACDVICSQRHEELNHQFIVEPLYNYELFQSTSQIFELNKPQKQTIEIKPTLRFKVQNELPLFKIDSNVEPKLKTLILFDSSYMRELNSELMDRQAKLKVNASDDYIELICECTHELPSNEIEHEVLKRKWEDDITSFFRVYVEQFDVKQIEIKYPEQTLPKLVIDSARVKLVRADNNNNNNLFEVVGFTESVTSLINEIRVKDVIQLPVSNEVIEDYIENLRTQELRILIIEGFISLVRERHSRMMNKIDMNEKKITLCGTRDQIEDAKQIAMGILSRVVHEGIPAEIMKIRFFSLKENEVSSWLRDNNVPCVIVADQENELIRIFSTQRSEIQRCKNMLKNDIKLVCIDHNQLVDFKDFQIETFIRSHRTDEGVVIDAEFGNVYVCGFEQQANDLFRSFFSVLTD